MLLLLFPRPKKELTIPLHSKPIIGVYLTITLNASTLAKYSSGSCCECIISETCCDSQCNKMINIIAIPFSSLNCE